MDLRKGDVLAGKLRLLRVLGQGGMGVVWEARHLTLDTDVAVKVIRPERVAADPTLVARFEREARATARIAHPHVVRIMDYGVDGAVPFIVMDLLRGFSLADVLGQGGRLSLATTEALVRQVGAALAMAHERGVVHRDIKPQNLFLAGGRGAEPLFVTVLDFGVAKLLCESGGTDAHAALTEAGLVIGSAPYMSPEQLEGRSDVDERSDLWSLGVIAYEALTGTRPFHGDSFVAVGAAVLKGRYLPASELQPNLTEAIDDWFARALSVDPAGRFASARAMAEAFPVAPAAVPLPGDWVVPEPPSGATAPTADHAAGAVAPAKAAGPSHGRDAKTLRLAFAAFALATVTAAGLYFHARATAAADCPRGMARIAGAAFAMGSPQEGDTPSDETQPVGNSARVAVGSFCLDETEVTVGAYLKCPSCEPPPRTVDFEGLTPNGRAFESEFCNAEDAPLHPINCVDWHQAGRYCAAVGKRLPTEAEWELAARGKAGRTYAWGDTAPAGDRLNACGRECSRMLTARLEKLPNGAPPLAPWPTMYRDDDSAAATAPVGRYPRGATPEGVLDLAGNVWEWTASPYCPYPFDQAADCGDSRRVLRGGGWDTTDVSSVRAARRYPSTPRARGKSIGFRCAKSP